MIDAKNKFREGFIMLLRPFSFAELKDPIQKLTILWAYSEQAIIKNILTEKAKEEIDLINNTTGPLFMTKNQKEEWLEEEIGKIFSDKSNYEKLYEGEIVQCIVEGQTCRFYPDEYKIITPERVFEIMQEEGYHTIISEEVKKLPDFISKSHYLRSRGIPKNIAEKWTSLSYQSLVIYKPYFQLLEMFCRNNEIYSPDSFYEEVEGIKIEELVKI